MASILIADDSVHMRKILCAILQETGHSVVAEAVNGYDAYLKYNDHHPDLVLMDINMPYMNGIEGLKLILARHPFAKVIMVSAENCSSLISHVTNLGAKDFIIKPFGIDCLVNSINKALHQNIGLDHDKLTRIQENINAL